MPEDYWERKRRHLSEDHAARRAESKRTMDLIRSQAEVDRLAAATGESGSPADQTFSETFRRLGVEWIMTKTSVMKEIAGNEHLAPQERAEWHLVLERSALTDRDDEPLEGLRSRVFREAMKFDQELDRKGTLFALFGSLGTLIDIRVRARAEL
jgi:hypothetical protein